MRYVYENELEKIKQEIGDKAKYQKVMLLFDDSASNTQIEKLKGLIKNDCIFNSKHIKNFDETEVNNGYKMIIFLCCVDSFLMLKIDRSQFNNIYFSTGELLPFFVNGYEYYNEDDLVVLKNNMVDNFALRSLFTTKFYSHLENLYYQQFSDIIFDHTTKEITELSVFTTLNEMKGKLKFVDVAIIVENKLSYKYLPLVDVMLCDAFICLLQIIKEKNVTMVDVYKVAKDDDVLIDKFYSKSNDTTFLDLINLNNQTFFQTLNEIKSFVVDNFNYSYSKEDVEKVFFAFKESSKNNNSILCYLYLLNIFNE